MNDGPTHLESEAFLAAIVANPDDDLPRLVYADWLDEHGDPDRAAFIRVQIELARLPVHDPRRVELAGRERALLADHKTKWKLIQFPNQYQVFHRGFVDRIEATADWLLANPNCLLAAPMVRELKVVFATRVGMQLTHLPGLERIEHLDLTNNSAGTEFTIPAFLAEARLDGLQALTLGNCGLRQWVIEELVALPVCRQLVRLALWGNPFGDEGARLLAEGTNFSGLKSLDLSSHRIQYLDCIHADGATALANAATLTDLRELDLSDHFIGDAGLIALVGSPNAHTLERLAVAKNDIGELGDSGIEAVVASPHLENMRELMFGRNRLSPLGAESLRAWPHLERMRFVDLQACEMSENTRRVLRSSLWADKFVM